MKTRRRWIIPVLSLLIITLLAVSGVAIHHHTTHASSGIKCFSGVYSEVSNGVSRPSLPGCAGLDPRDQGCSADASNAKTEDINRDAYTVTLSIRYSSNCNAWWVRAIASPATAVRSVTVYNWAAPFNSDPTKNNTWQSSTGIDGTMQAYSNMSLTLPVPGPRNQAQAFAIVVSQNANDIIYFDH